MFTVYSQGWPPRLVDDSIDRLDPFDLFRGHLEDMDRVVRTILFAEFATDTGFDVDMDQLEDPMDILSPLHLEAFGNRTPVDAVFTPGAGISLHNGLHLGSRCPRLGGRGRGLLRRGLL